MPSTAAPPRSPVVDAAGRPVRLGAELGRGGEGNVYEVADAPELVAKVYHAAADADKAAKLAAMVRGASAALTDVAAWPTATLHPAGSAGGAGAPVIGLVMPRARGAPVHRLYSPVSRRAELPTVDWQRLVLIAHNLAAAVAQVHAAGHVIGDVNQGNALVAPGGRVRLIDCDSFQVRDGARWFPCEVGVAHFTPPELQGRGFAGVLRTPNHDAFGLAVLVFHLLFMGRHPFAGRYGGAGDMPIEQAIAGFRFAFGRNAAALRMAPPPHALALASASPGVAELFERAFGPDGVRDGGRPTAGEWTTALGALAHATIACAAVPTHTYPRDLGACPWCAIAEAGGPDFFAVAVPAVRPLAGFDVAAVWTAVLAVPAPERRPVLTSAPPAVRTSAPPVPRWRRLAWWGQAPVGVAAGASLLGGISGPFDTPAVAVACGLSLLFVGLRRGSGLIEERARREPVLEAARARLHGIEERWTRELGAAGDRFHMRRLELAALRAEHQDLEATRQRGRQDPEAMRREYQLRQHLGRQVIAWGGVPGIGARLAATLASHGIATAADVSYAAVAAVPGFSGARARELVSWRRSREQTFRFDPVQDVDPAELAAFEGRVARRQDEVERALAAGPGTLHQLGLDAQRLREQLTRELDAQQVALGTAAADMAAVGGALPAKYRTRAWGAAIALVLGLANVASLHREPTVVADRPAATSPATAASGQAAPAAPRASSGDALFEFQVEKQAGVVPGTLALTYPPLLQAMGREGRVTVQFVVSATGTAELNTFRVLETTDDAFSAATRAAVAAARFYPAEVGGRKVRQLVQLPVTFAINR